MLVSGVTQPCALRYAALTVLLHSPGNSTGSNPNERSSLLSHQHHRSDDSTAGYGLFESGTLRNQLTCVHNSDDNLTMWGRICRWVSRTWHRILTFIRLRKEEPKPPYVVFFIAYDRPE